MTDDAPVKDIDYWSGRINELQKEAEAYGFGSVCVIVDEDRLGSAERVITVWEGLGPLCLIGAAHVIRGIGQKAHEDPKGV